MTVFIKNLFLAINRDAQFMTAKAREQKFLERIEQARKDLSLL